MNNISVLFSCNHTKVNINWHVVMKYFWYVIHTTLWNYRMKLMFDPFRIPGINRDHRPRSSNSAVPRTDLRWISKVKSTCGRHRCGLILMTADSIAGWVCGYAADTRPITCQFAGSSEFCPFQVELLYRIYITSNLAADRFIRWIQTTQLKLNSYQLAGQCPLSLTWFNFNPSMDK